MIGDANLDQIRINGHETTALIDSGSQVSTITEVFYNMMSPKPDMHSMDEFNLSLKSANGSEIPYKGYIFANVETSFTTEAMPTILLVVPVVEYHGTAHVLLGQNILRELKPVAENITLNNVWQAGFMSIDADVGLVTATRPITLHPGESRTVTGFFRKPRNVKTAITEPVDDMHSHSAIVCPRVVQVDKPGRTARIPVRICNVSAKPIKIRAKQNLCKLEEITVLREAPIFEPVTNASVSLETKSHEHAYKYNKTNMKDTYGIDLEDTDLSEEQKNRVYQLFEKHNAIFPKSPLDLGHTSEIKHTIKLTNNEPFKEPYRRIPPAVYNEVREHLKEMLDLGAIRESNSPWSSNCVIVRKKNGEIRFCIDFRKLNERTKKDSYAIPRIEDTLHLLSGSKYFSKLDLKAGYWQVELEEEDKEKTAFQVGGLGFYECNRLPFGLCNAPATFQRLMERCMGDLNLRDCLIYLDDIIIFSNDINSHISRLDQVFSKLASFNLKIKPSKCEFFKTKTTYLGHVVSADGISADPEKTEAVRNWPTPTNVKEVRKFLGFVGYYRRFIKGFSNIARPLNDLLIGQSNSKTVTSIKKVKFEWAEEQQKAFANLKQQLVNPPVLAYANYELPFILHTDASSQGLGAVLYQHQDGKDRVVAYASRSLKPAEKSYPAHKLEFLALKWSVTEKFHDYLYGATFEVVTDNNPLTYVTTTAKLDATGQRWMAALANYNFTPRYRAGRQNADADGLSRLTVDHDTITALSSGVTARVEDTPLCFSIVNPETLSEVDCSTTIPEEVMQSYALSSKDWHQAQHSDPVISDLIKCIQQGTRPTALRASGTTSAVTRYNRDWDKLELHQGVLYRDSMVGNQSCKQLILPEALRDEVFRALHDDLGHQGRDRTTSLFKQRFYWPGMETFIRDKVAACDRCIRRKAIPQSASLVNITTSAPMEMICLDYLSLERSKGGFEHILVITDHFTRYAQAYPTTNQTAKTTARVLFDKFIVHYGFPERIHSDRGANFMSNLISELCHLGGINQSRTTPYHAMGNGMVERFNQTLLKMLGTLEEDKKSNWKDFVGPMVHAYNATLHDSTGYSPYFLMFGRHPRLAIDALLGLHFDDINARYANEYTRKLRQRLTTSYQKAKEIASKTAEINKRKYDLKVRAAKLVPGDLVLVRNVTLRGKQKIADRWENEPYIVVCQPNVDIPVYDVKKDNPRARRIRRLHRNLILPLGIQNEEVPETETRATGTTPKYVIPQRRRNISLVDDDGRSDTTPILRRSTRIRRTPKRFTSD